MHAQHLPEKRQLIYEGSVKKLYQVKSDVLELEFTDAYSVFDWGKMPDQLAGKGRSLALMAAFFFEKLSSEGIQNHFLCFKETQSIQVREARSDSENNSSSGRFIPLEVVFRFGMPQGSSLAQRLTPEYLKEIGLEERPKEGQFLSSPVVEFFTKKESVDRVLTLDEASVVSKLSREQLLDLKQQTLRVAQWLKIFFDEKGLELWDGKLEWAFNEKALKGESWILIDSIGPDELRLLDKNSKVQVSKEFLRKFYRGTSWFQKMEQVKKTCTKEELRTGAWKQKVEDQCGQPPSLPESVKEAATLLYATLGYVVTGDDSLMDCFSKSEKHFRSNAVQSISQLVLKIQKIVS